MTLRRDWLSRTHEEVLEPDLEIVDTHHHLWEVAGKYGIYDLDDLHLDTGSGHRVVETIFIEASASYRTSGPESMRPIGETEFVASRAKLSDQGDRARITGIVGRADLSMGACVRDVLDGHVEAADGRFRGVRHTGARTDDATIAANRTQPVPGLYGLPSFRDGARVLADMGLSFDAWQYHPQLHEVVELARAVPGLVMVVNHIGGPLAIGGYLGRDAEVRADWQAGIEALAGLPNVYMKLGGLGTVRSGATWDEDDRPPTSDQVIERWGERLLFCIDRFGPSRCMFESNFPVDGRMMSYTVLWNAFKKLTVGFTDPERADLFAGTARRAYRL
ncbi:MAG: L-fuconolactonase [Myxococcota bacterium]|jgi:L-fuconolactonase